MLELNGLVAGKFVTLLAEAGLYRGAFPSNYDIFDFIVDGLLGLEKVKALSLIAVCVNKLMQDVTIVHVPCIHNCLGEIFIGVYDHAKFI